MTWAYVAVGAGTLISGYLGSQSSKKAANAAEAGSQAAIDEARRQFDLVRSDTAGQRLIGNGATSTLARLYGYGPAPSATGSSLPFGGAQTYQPGQIATNGGLAEKLHPWTGVTSKLGVVGKIADPAVLFGSVFGSKHGDEKRNLNAFLKDNQIYDLGNGTLAFADGRTFNKDQLQHIAGTYYGATYAPDGNQQDWQQRYSSLIGSLPGGQGGQGGGQGVQGNAGGGLTSDGVPNTAPFGGPVTIDNATGSVTPNGTPDMSAFFASPDYQFRLGEGQKAIDRSASARGGLLSGGAEKAGIRYASNLASGEFSNFVDRLMQQAGLGSTGIGASAAAGANTAGLVGNAAINGGNAKASSYLTGGAAINNAAQGGLQNFLLAKYLGG